MERIVLKVEPRLIRIFRKLCCRGRWNSPARPGKFLVNDEEQNMLRMVDFSPAIYGARMQPISEKTLLHTVAALKKKASGKLLHSAEWRYGLAIDDMIARAHDVDPNLAWKQRTCFCSG